ncbi:hypothetical protein C8R45DRAFT_1206017 [Mycena sanguinolenta]|nr:hypothetical protein C8R45DRAFT_1206017 [Mycena sanguinolenta]
MFCSRRRRREREGEQPCSLPQELVDECLSHLDHFADLKACALVCRSWSFAAQRFLFESIFVSTSRPQDLEKTLIASPYLVPHIHTLVFCRPQSQLNTKAFTKLCGFPFTHLSEIAVDYQYCLLFVKFRYIAISTAQPCFARWNNYSPSIRHLHWNVNPTRVDIPCTHRHSSAPIALESLRLRDVRNLAGWFDDDDDAGYPFDFSRLAILSADDVPRLMFAWPHMAPALQNLEALEFHASCGINLSWFPNLLFLCIQFVSLNMVTNRNPLSTITSSSRIQDIVLDLAFPMANECDELDSILAHLPMQRLPIVGLVMDDVYKYTFWTASFPRLNSKNLVCSQFVYYLFLIIPEQLYHVDYDWLEAQLRRRNSLH